MNDFQKMMNERPDLQSFLFRRGFLFTDAVVDLEAFPFYGHWNVYAVGEYTAYTHELQKVTVCKKFGKSFFLFGHAYNPFTMKKDEADVLDRISDAYGSEDYQ